MSNAIIEFGQEFDDAFIKLGLAVSVFNPADCHPTL